MCDNEKKQNDILNEQFKNDFDNLKFFEESRQHFESQFLQVKGILTAFVGIIFSVAVVNPVRYYQIILPLKWVALVSFVLFVIELWVCFIKVRKQLRNQSENVILSHINRIAVNEPEKFRDYGKGATVKRLAKDVILKFMENNIQIDKIIKANLYEIDWWFYCSLIVWTVIVIILLKLFFLIL